MIEKMIMELQICPLVVVPLVCAILTYFLFRKVQNGVSKKSAFALWYSTLKFWWCNEKKKSVYSYLNEAKFDKLKIIEHMEIEELQKKFQEDISVCSLFYGSDQEGNSLFLKLNHRGNDKELILFLYLSDGRVYELPDHPSTIAFNSTNQSWSIGGIRIYVCEPFIRWRITFNGLLRNGTRKNITDDMGKMEHVRFNFIFIANSVPLVKSDFSSDFAKEQFADLEGFDQWGSLVGQILFQDSSTKECFLRGLRQQKCERQLVFKFDKVLSCFGTVNGLSFYLNIGKFKDNSEVIKFGHLKTINNTIFAIDWMDLNVDCDVNLEKNDSERIHFKAGDDCYKFSIKFQKDSKRFLHRGLNVDKKYVTYNIQLSHNNKEGSGLVFVWYPQKNSATATEIISENSVSLHFPEVQESKTFVVPFRDAICQNEEFVGGKAKSLALLSSIETNDFDVPQGFCIAASALQCQINSYENLSSAINHIEWININQTENLKNSCDKVISLLKTLTIVEPVRKEILKALSDLENDEINNQMNLRYAVRSSAIGEDSEETSAAGQNSTFLGIQHPDNVLKYVSHCWASLYTYQSVEYRRRLGLPVKASMGVCIQVMVDAEIAGVMFTRHPSTGDPRNIVITSNYGLGETVVSAMVEPDTVIIERNWNDTLTIESIEIGKKYQKISMTKDSGTIVSELSDEESRRNSIPNKIALNLAKVGVNLENLFQNARDIEWAIIGDKIFLLQSRPITSLDNWTDFELTHELDSIVPVESDILTFDNVGEVFPGVTSPLTVSTFVYRLNGSVNDNFKKPSLVPYCDHHIHVSSMRVTMNYFNTLLANVSKEMKPSVKITDVAVCGHVTTTPEIYDQAKERNGILNWLETLLQILDMISDIWKAEATLKEMEKVFANMKLDASRFDTIEDLYRSIDDSLIQLDVVGRCHNLTSRVSVFYEILLVSILMENSDDLTVDHFSDIAVLLSSCNNVISAQVPIALRRIANLIRDTGKWEEFSQINANDVVNWLEKNSPQTVELLKEFLKTYGHRNIKEMDFMTETWDMKPEKLFSALQAMVKVPLDKTEIVELTPEETVMKLKVPKKNATRWILRKIVPFGRKAVARREMTKSILTNALHKFRLSYRKLAKLLMEKSRLPDENLIFFLTHYEIGLLVKRPDYFLVRKAFRRQRLFTKLEKDKFPELMIGVPKPLELVNNSRHLNRTKVTGSSVYNGTVYSRACVITNVSQADEIEPGDILITRATDIGWSPYFPLLGGIVTELGGLISHGAVVAREYGIPCIVGAKGATLIFKTGQMVLLNATVGTMEVAEEKS